MSEPIDVIVVGGGIGGLLVAAQVARAGRSVRVLERASHVGGHALSPPVGGVPMNLGAHALYRGGPAEQLLADLGVAFEGFQPSASDTWLAEGASVVRSPTSVLGMLGAGWMTLSERFALLRFFAMLDGAQRVENLSTREWLDRAKLPARARRFVDTTVRVSTYSNAEELLPAEIALRQLRVAVGRRAKGVVYVDGGWRSLVEGVLSIATGAGARVVTGAQVTRVHPDGHVELADGETLAARHVVIALPRTAAARLVGWDAPPLPALRAACLDLVLDAAPSRRLVLGLDEPHYFSVHSRPQDSAPIRAHALRYLAPGDMGAEYKDVLERWVRAVVPDVQVRAQRFLPDLDAMSAMPARGAEAPSFERVSFAGDWTTFGHELLDAVAESAVAAAARALAERTRAAA